MKEGEDSVNRVVGEKMKMNGRDARVELVVEAKKSNHCPQQNYHTFDLSL